MRQVSKVASLKSATSVLGDLAGLRFNEMMPHRLFSAPQRNRLGESETTACQVAHVLVRRGLDALWLTDTGRSGFVRVRGWATAR